MTLWERLRVGTRPGASGWVPYAVSSCFVLVTYMARIAVDPWVADRAPLLPFAAAVVASAGLYGVGPGLFATALSLLLACWTFIRPSGFAPDALVGIGVFVVTSEFMLIFANHLRSARQRSLALENELQYLHTTAAMGTMARTLAHELNQPLTAASNYIAACQQIAALTGGEENVELSKRLGKAEDQVQRAGSIIREARTLLGNFPVARSETSVRDLIDRVIEITRATGANRYVGFNIDIAWNARIAVVNAVQIEQVLLNIMRNACQALQGTKNPRIRLQCRAADRGILIQVQDNGPGIPGERLADLFSPSQVATETGLGIGLSICRTIVEGHGGSIRAHNNPEGGASFFIFLPSNDGVVVDDVDEGERPLAGSS
ncbi:MAG TPA: ATP-binding protein [Sphingomicrobium sp.]|nr:ATP-binding protein [Sphingomicrobium sp.]